jgi:hypothetical protein
MTYEMPAIADTVDLDGALTDLAFSIRCTQCDVDEAG